MKYCPILIFLAIFQLKAAAISEDTTQAETPDANDRQFVRLRNSIAPDMLPFAKKCLHLCKETYTITAKKNNTANRKYINISGHLAVLLEKDQSNFFIAFRGTKSVDDMIYDVGLGITPIPNPSGEFDELGYFGFSGFVVRYSEFAEQIKEKILEFFKDSDEMKNHTFYSTGHSLGGALAQLCVYDMKNRLKIQNIHLVTFSSPAVFSQKPAQFTAQAIGDSYRFFVKEDIIPKLLPEELGFYQIGTPIELTATFSEDTLRISNRPLERLAETVEEAVERTLLASPAIKLANNERSYHGLTRYYPVFDENFLKTKSWGVIHAVRFASFLVKSTMLKKISA